MFSSEIDDNYFRKETRLSNQPPRTT